MNRTYNLRLPAKVSISEAGALEVEVDLVNLPWEIENDPRAPHGEAEIEADANAVRALLMESPFNHSISAKLNAD